MSVGPIYGAPLVGDGTLSCSSVGEMLSEVFFDCNRPWVKDYLFKPDPQVQAALLTSPHGLERSLAFTQRTASDPDIVPAEFSFDKFMVGLVVPAGLKEGLGTAVMVESHSPGDGLMNRADRVLQVVSDARAGSVLAVSVDDTRKIVEVWYNKTERFFMMGTFQEKQFREAIKHDAVDFFGLQKAMMFSLTGSRECECDSTRTAPPVHTVLAKNGDTGTAMDGCGMLFPNRSRIAVGDWYSKNMLAFYDGADGNVLFSTMSASITSRNFGCVYGAVDEMKRFAVRDRLGRAKLSIPMNVNMNIPWEEGLDFLNELLDTAAAAPRRDSFGSRDGRNDSNSHSTTTILPAISMSTTISKVRRVRIAPASTSTTTPSPKDGGRELSYAEKADLEYAAKMERKRERNRLAAKKSNAKKRAAREKRREKEGLG